MVQEILKYGQVIENEGLTQISLTLETTTQALLYIAATQI